MVAHIIRRDSSYVLYVLQGVRAANLSCGTYKTQTLYRTSVECSGEPQPDAERLGVVSGRIRG